MIMGGQQESALKKVVMYNVATGERKAAPNLLKPRVRPSSCCLKDFVYTFGGYVGKKYLSSIERLDVTTQLLDGSKIGDASWHFV